MVFQILLLGLISSCFSTVIVEQSFDGSKWEKRGEIENSKFYYESNYWNLDMINDADFYYIRFTSEDRIIFQKRYPKCNVVDSGFKETIKLFGKTPLLDLDHNLKKINRRNKCKIRGKKIKQSIYLAKENVVSGKKVNIRGYLNSVKVAKNVDDRGFIAKYWKWLLIGFLGLTFLSALAK